RRSVAVDARRRGPPGRPAIGASTSFPGAPRGRRGRVCRRTGCEPSPTPSVASALSAGGGRGQRVKLGRGPGPPHRCMTPVSRKITGTIAYVAFLGLFVEIALQGFYYATAGD